MQITIDPEFVEKLINELNFLREIIEEKKVATEFPQFINLVDTINGQKVPE